MAEKTRSRQPLTGVFIAVFIAAGLIVFENPSKLFIERSRFGRYQEVHELSRRLDILGKGQHAYACASEHLLFFGQLNNFDSSRLQMVKRRPAEPRIELARCGGLDDSNASVGVIGDVVSDLGDDITDRIKSADTNRYLVVSDYDGGNGTVYYLGSTRPIRRFYIEMN